MMMTEMFMELLYVHHEEITGEKDPVYDEVAAVLEERVREGDNSSFTIGALARISSSAFAIARLEEAVRLRPEDETLWIVSWMTVVVVVVIRDKDWDGCNDGDGCNVGLVTTMTVMMSTMKTLITMI